jgi:LuxR family maltose regulon positive regulatory protein
LLRAAIAHDRAARQATVLLAAAERAAPAAPSQGLVDELSPRELEVLRLLRTDLSGPEIAARLVVSLNTVRTHTKAIFTKLGVNSRRAAVSRADHLGL